MFDYFSKNPWSGKLWLEALNRIIKERKGKEKPISVSKVPSREDVMEITCEAEEYPNKKISLYKFIGLFIPEEENYGVILDDMTIKGKIHVSRAVLQWFGYDGEYKKQRQNFKKMLTNNEISYYELTQEDEEIELYPSIDEELQLIPSNVTNTKFLIMEQEILKWPLCNSRPKMAI